MVSAWWRTGAGGIRWRFRIRRIGEAPTRWPSLTSSPCTLRYPQLGFSIATLPRDLTRYRADLVNARTAEKSRVEKLLEDAQIKLSVVASDIFGVSGREMMAALLAGERNPKALAQLARSRMRARIPLLEEAFVGHFTTHHAFLLRTMLARIDQASADIAAVETQIEELITPFAPAVEKLDEITGVGITAAHVIIAEIGVDMTRFATAAHLLVVPANCTRT